MKKLSILAILFSTLAFTFTDDVINTNHVSFGVENGRPSISFGASLTNDVDYSNFGISNGRFLYSEASISSDGVEHLKASVFDIGMLSLLGGNLAFGRFDYERDRNLKDATWMGTIKAVDWTLMLPIGVSHNSMAWVGGRVAGGPGSTTKISDSTYLAPNLLVALNMNLYGGDFFRDNGTSFIIKGDYTQEFLFLENDNGQKNSYGVSVEFRYGIDPIMKNYSSVGLIADLHQIDLKGPYTVNSDYKGSLKAVVRF